MGWGDSWWTDPPVLFSLYVSDMPLPSHHDKVGFYSDDTAIIAKSLKPTMLVSYLESYLNDLQQWLSEWRIVINVSKNTTVVFAQAGQRFIQREQYHFSGNQSNRSTQLVIQG
jgi:hypothetical protein